jgi:hypothetical protein
MRLIPTLGQSTGYKSPRRQQAASVNEAWKARAMLRVQSNQAESMMRDRVTKNRKQTSEMLAAEDARNSGPAPTPLGDKPKGIQDSSSMVARTNKEVQWPNAPKYKPEPVGSLERGMPAYFSQMSERNANDTDKTYYNAWKQEMAAKERVRQENAAMDASYNRSADAYNAEMQERKKASDVPQPQAPASEVAEQKRTQQGKRKPRASLLAGETGGYNPATGNTGRLGQRSLLG